MNQKLPQKIFRRLLIAVFAVIGVLCLWLLLHKPAEQRQDYKTISSMEFDAAFLSMYPLDSYREEDFAYFRAMTLFKASYCIPDYSVLKDYMKHIAKSGNIITTIYLGLCPDRISPAELQALIEPYPSVTFEVIFSYPSAEYWQELSAKKYESVLNDYCSFLKETSEITGANFYFFGSSEWLISNPGNYKDQWQLNEALSQTVMLNSDCEKPAYLLTPHNAEEKAAELSLLTWKLRNHPDSYPDLSDCAIVFFGDSVIANYTDSASIPGVVAGLTGAAVYNCGYGGNSAAMSENAPISLPGIVDAFFRGDLSVIPGDIQAYQGISSYLENPPDQDKPLCFVINYGLNDYFSGLPVTSQDPYDITSYCGAIRSAVNFIRTNAPQAQIILCSPTFSPIFQDGTEIMGENGSPLQYYADALLALARELDTDVLDNYYDLGINHDNQGAFLADQVHPNASCRYIIGSRLARLIH